MCYECCFPLEDFVLTFYEWRNNWLDGAWSLLILAIISSQGCILFLPDPTRILFCQIILFLYLLSKPRLNHYSTQPNITLSWVRHENDFAYHPIPTPTTQTQCYQYFSCYWPNFNETLNIGSWEHSEQVPPVTVTFVQKYLSWGYLSYIWNISDVTDPMLTKL